MAGYPTEQQNGTPSSAPDQGNGPGQSHSYGIEDSLDWIGSSLGGAAEATYHAGAQVYNAGVHAAHKVQEDYQRARHVVRAFELADTFLSPILEKRIGMEGEELKKSFIAGLEKILLFLALTTLAGAAGGAIVGAFAGGVGAAPGAVVGGELGLDAGLWLLEYLGLAILIVHIGIELPDILEKVRRGAKAAWNAGVARPASLQSDIHNAAYQLAEAEADLMVVILDAVLAWVLKDSAALKSEKMLKELQTLKAGMKDAEALAARSEEIVEALRNKPAEMEAAINKAIDEFAEKLRKASRLTEGLIDFVKKNFKKMLENSAKKEGPKPKADLGGGQSSEQLLALPAPAKKTPIPASEQVKDLSGHGHGRHGAQTTIPQQTTRVQTGLTADGVLERRRVPTSSRFSSDDAELDAVQRGQALTDQRLASGEIDTTIKVAPDGTAMLPRDATTVTGFPGGYGDGVQVLRDPITDAPLPGRPVQPTGPLPNAKVVLQYNPATGTWDPVTQYPSSDPITRPPTP